MEPTEKPKFNWIRLAVISSIVILTALAVGGATWYVMDQQAEKDKGEFERQIQELENQKEIEETAEENTATKTTQNETKKDNTYTDSIGKYSITIPDGYIASVLYNYEGLSGTQVTLNKKVSNIYYTPKMLTLSTMDFREKKTLSEWNKEVNFMNENSTIEEDGTKVIGGVTATRYTEKGFFGQSTIYRFIHGNIGYNIEYTDDFVDKSLVNSIISSFKLN